MTIVEKSRGLKQRIAAALAKWIYPEIISLDEVKSATLEWHAALETAAMPLPQDEWTTKMIPCVHCKREIPEFDAYCQHCRKFQDESSKDDTQPLYWIKINHELHFFQLETGKPLIDGKRPFKTYVEAMHKDKDDWLL